MGENLVDMQMAVESIISKDFIGEFSVINIKSFLGQILFLFNHFPYKRCAPKLLLTNFNIKNPWL